ncbi:Crp/Fnr family transcriptional regulator [Micromonospora sp. NPDC050397]|uniref:Crp/Fnr family transcriptional regulator n=1 Tax=Micromonospora sp. NPDC050397 TaxID=3364279 RepID=UPI00384CE616
MNDEGDTKSIPWRPGSFLHSLGPDSRARLLRLGTRRRFPANDALVHSGDTSDNVFVILAGIVKIEATDPLGRAVTLALRGPGDAVGELAALTEETRSATIRAALDTAVVTITNADFRQFLIDDPFAGFALTKMIAKRLSAANQQRVSLGSQNVIARLANVLGMLADAFGEQRADGVVIAVPISQSELASMIGAAEVSTQKALRTLRDQGVVQVGYRRIMISSRDHLDAMAHPGEQ